MQEIGIIIVFAAALGYLGYRIYRSLAPRQTGCGKGCGCTPEPGTAAKKPENLLTK